MKKKTIIQVLLFLIFLSGGYQNASAKKIVYLGHEYNGKVNKQNIPEGKGKIDIGGLIIEGFFEGNTINDATFSTEWLSYNGTVTYDRDMKIVLKQGGKFIKYYYNQNDIRTAPAEATTYRQPIIYKSSLQGVKKRSVTENLDTDKEVDKDLLYKETLKLPVSFEMEDVPNELNPPHVDTTRDYPLIKYRIWDNHLNNDEMFAYVVPTKVSKWGIDYKDEQNRLWYYSREEVKGEKSPKVTYKVTYPDGSFYSNSMLTLLNQRHAGAEGLDRWMLYYPDGKSLTSRGVLTIPEGVLHLNYSSVNRASADDFLKWKNSNTIPNIKVYSRGLEFIYKNNDISAMSNDAVISLVREKLMPYINASDNTSIILKNKDGQVIGVYYYENDKYVSEIDRKKEADAKEAAEEKARQAEAAKAEKARQAKLAPYIKRFGFNPSGKSIKQLVAVGRSFSLVNDYLNDYYVGGQNFWFSFAEDTGISKGYRVIMNNKRVGYIYVQNNRIISVTWR